MLKPCLLVGAAITFAASQALAADIVGPTTYDWTGPYIGLNAGYGEADVEYQFRTIGHYNNDPGDDLSQTLDGFVAGIQTGYNWQIDSFVLGLEGGFTWLNFDQEKDSPFFDTDTFITRVNWVGSITPRLGVALDNILFFAKGGVAFAGIDARIEDTADFVETNKTQVGWTVGGGIDYGLSERWTVGAEGNYYDFGSFDAGKTVQDFGGSPRTDRSDHDVDTSVWTVSARANFRF